MEHERYERRCGKRQPRATQPDSISARDMRRANEAAIASGAIRKPRGRAPREFPVCDSQYMACGRATREVSPKG